MKYFLFCLVLTVFFQETSSAKAFSWNFFSDIKNPFSFSKNEEPIILENIPETTSDKTGWGSTSFSTNSSRQDISRHDVYINNVPLKLTIDIITAQGKHIDLLTQSHQSGFVSTLDTVHPTVLNYHEVMPFSSDDYAQILFPKKGLIFGAMDPFHKDIFSLENMMLVSRPEISSESIPTERISIMRGYRVDITPSKILDEHGNSLPLTDSGILYHDGDIVNAEVAFLTYIPFKSDVKVALPHEKLDKKNQDIKITIPILSYASVIQKVSLQIGKPITLTTVNQTTGSKFILTISVLPQNKMR